MKRRPKESATDYLFRLSRRSAKQVLVDDGLWLTEWLNDWPEREGDKARVKVLLDRLQKLNSVLRSARGTSAWKVPEIGKLEADLEKLTRHYISWPRYGAELDCSGLGVAHIPLRGSLEESQARGVIEKLIAANLLEKLDFCATCKRRWVFRYKSTWKYCSRQCRQSRYEATPRRKAKKAERNREYYERWLRRNRKRRKQHAKK